MGFSSTYFNICALAMSAIGITCLGFSIYAMVETHSSQFACGCLAFSILYVAMSIFGLISHRFNALFGLQLYGFLTVVLTLVQFVAIILLNAAQTQTLDYIKKIDGGSSDVANKGYEMIDKSKVVWTVAMCVTLVMYLIQIFATVRIRRAIYQEYIKKEYLKIFHGANAKSVTDPSQGDQSGVVTTV